MKILKFLLALWLIDVIANILFNVFRISTISIYEFFIEKNLLPLGLALSTEQLTELSAFAMEGFVASCCLLLVMNIFHIFEFSCIWNGKKHE